MTKLTNRLASLERGLDRLREAVTEAETDLEIDGVIQRFEFTYELFWKCLKAYLELQGIRCRSPRDCFKEAYALQLIQDEEIALRLIEDRNETVHLYDEEKSREVYRRVQSQYLPLFETAARALRDRTTT